MGYRWRQAAGALLLVFAFARGGAIADADTQRIPTTASPVLFVQTPQGNITLRTWGQQAIQVQGDSGTVVRHFGSDAVARHIPLQVMLWSLAVARPDGDLRLPPETFVLPPLSPDPHDAVVVRGDGDTTIDVPDGTALIIGNVRRGIVSIDGYRNGIFVSHVGIGAVRLRNVSGTGAIQVNDGPVSAQNSQFTRLRVRTARGNMRFEHCASSEIQATSLLGSIMYDNGSFVPGLARFESERGNVALGIVGNGLISAHSSVGKIFSDAPGFASGMTDAQATIGRGGPVVTATSATGSVIFYNGALRSHPRLERRIPRFGLQQKFPHHRHIHFKGMLR